MALTLTARTTANLSRIAENCESVSRACAAMMSTSKKSTLLSEEQMTKIEATNALFEQYVAANKAGDYALAQRLSIRWMAATAAL